jgi:4-hydroxybenzoate polyprenyltransferase
MRTKRRIRSYIDALRLERWPRSLAIIPGFVAYLVLTPQLLKESNIYDLLGKLVIAFILTLLISTANYIINEIADAPYDAFHPTKKDRPLVKNEINIKILLGLWFLMVFISIIVSILLYKKPFLLMALGALLFAGILYNVPPARIKDIPYLDSTLESSNNPIRFLIGWYMLGTVFPPVSLLICWWAFGNFLMVGKRVAEKKFLTQEESSGYRLSLKRYSLKGLKIFMISNAVIFIASFCVFAVEWKMTSFLYSIPFILIYLLMFMKKSHQDIEGAEEPEKLLKNPYFAFFTLFLVAIFILAYIFK